MHGTAWLHTFPFTENPVQFYKKQAADYVKILSPNLRQFKRSLLPIFVQGKCKQMYLFVWLKIGWITFWIRLSGTFHSPLGLIQLRRNRIRRHRPVKMWRTWSRSKHQLLQAGRSSRFRSRPEWASSEIRTWAVQTLPAKN